jgi:opacity protein-like surface antigen
MFRWSRLIFTTVIFMMLSSGGFAQKHRIGFFLNAAGFFPAQDNISSGFGSGLGAVFYIGQNVSLSFEWKYSRFSVAKKEGEFLKGTLTMTPLLASIRYKIQTGTALSPYIFGGAGLFFNTLSLDERLSPEDKNVKKQEIKNGLGLCGGIGSSYKITERISFFIEGLYLIRKADVETFFVDNSPGKFFEANFHSLSVLIGLEYSD